jgi:hypothetical protein
MSEVKVEEKKAIKPVCLQHIGKIRQFYVHADRVIKIYRGAASMQKGTRFEKTVVLNPGCVVDVTPDLAEWLLKKRDFQKYGVK